MKSLKFDGGLGQTNFYVPLTRKLAELKSVHLLASYPSQTNRSWFCAGTFEGLMADAGMECKANDGFAEAFHLRKMIL